MAKVQVRIVSGDISRFPADALITAINSGGMWFGGIDSVIQRAAGGIFHRQAKQAMPLYDGKTVVATTNDSTHRGAFGDVVFVVDDLQRKLSEIIAVGLHAASLAGYKKVSLPTIRMGVMLGVVEKTIQEAINEMALGVKQFLAENPETPIKTITFVVHNETATERMLKHALSTL